MRNLIYQYYLPYSKGEEKPGWVDIGVTSAKDYAESIGAEYQYSEEKWMNSSIAVFESLRLIFDERFDEFDNILLLDVDMIINTTENIFDIPIEDVGMVHEHGVKNRPAVPGAKFDDEFWSNYFYHPFKGIVSYGQRHLSPMFSWKRHKKDSFILYNGGLQLWSRDGRIKARNAFSRKEHDRFRLETNKGETPYLNMMFIHHKFNVTELDGDWNRLNFQWQRDGRLGKITHYNDISKDGMYTHGK